MAEKNPSSSVYVDPENEGPSPDEFKIDATSGSDTTVAQESPKGSETQAANASVTLDLGSGVTLELVYVSEGTFIYGV